MWVVEDSFESWYEKWLAYVKSFQFLKDAPLFGSSTDEMIENDCY